MLERLAWLGLEAPSLAATAPFYGETLGLSVDREGPDRLAVAAGATTIRLQRPSGLPRGGVHTHYALAVPAGEYDRWWDRLEAAGHDLEEATFGGSRSLYCTDPAGHCVELGERAVDGPGIGGVFEVVLEVRSLERARERYEALGFAVVDEGTERRRVRLRGPMDLELWEPQLGIAGGQGGLHVDLGFEAADRDRVADALAGQVCSLERGPEALVAVDPDGHRLTVR